MTVDLLRSAVPLFSTELMRMVMVWMATFVLGVWGTSKEVGIFGVANRTTMLMSLILIAVNVISAPKFAELYRQGNIEALARTARHSTRLMVLIATPALVFFLAAPGLVMRLFGHGFEEGKSVLMILAAGQFMNVATGSVGCLLVMSRNERVQRNNVAFNMVLNILLCVVLTRLFGIIGAAAATAISVASVNLTALFLVRKHLSINIWGRN